MRALAPLTGASNPSTTMIVRTTGEPTTPTAGSGDRSTRRFAAPRAEDVGMVTPKTMVSSAAERLSAMELRWSLTLGVT
jgi:hypothetical protein